MNINDLIDKIRLNDVTEKSIFFEDINIKYIRAKKKHDFSSNKCHTYAEYFFIELNELIIAKIRYIDKFKAFQSKLLAPVFFNYVHDLRWNLYMIFLVNDNSLLKEIDINGIENDDNYGRKYIFKFDEALSFINREDIFVTSANNAKGEFTSGHYQEWIKILDKVKLTGCLSSNPLRESNVEEYLNGNNFEDQSFLNDSISRKNLKREAKKLLDRVCSLDMGVFRKHCFENVNTIEFGHVNLLHGSNGCGKTSITEAIELSITNEIKRLKDLKENIEDYSGLKLTCKSNGKFEYPCPGQDVSFYKRRDSIWYGVQSGMGKSTLGKSFNRYNYLDAEAAYRFTKEQSLNPDDEYDYKNGLKNLFFDDEILEIEKRWLWYHVKFLDKQKKLNSSSDEILRQKTEILGNISSLMKTNTSNIDEIMSLLVNIKFNTKTKSDNFKDNLQLMQALSETIKAVEETVNNLITILRIHNINKYELLPIAEAEAEKVIKSIKDLLSDITREKNKIVLELSELNQIEVKMET